MAYFYLFYLAIALVFLQINPIEATLNFGQVWGAFSGLLLQLFFAFFFVIIQFVGLFWFLSRGRTYVIYPREYDVTFSDVRGQAPAVRSAKEVLRLFQGFKDFRQMGGYPPHGILFEGPPGTGKTLMAKAIAGSSQVPFVYASGTSFANMFFGVGNLRISYLFRKARNLSDKYGGAVIFLDELDAVGGSRGGVQQYSDRDSGGQVRPNRVMFPGGMGMGGMLVNELLVQMDGLVMPRGLFWRHVKRFVLQRKPKVPFYNILIIGATNRADTLDPALLRPGRFDRKIHVGLPRIDGRKDIIKYYLAKVRHEPLDVDRAALMTQGYSPARIRNLINEALITALQDGRDALRFDDLWRAKLAEEVGLEEPPPESRRQREWTAVHEAGHFVISYSLLRGVVRTGVLTVRPRGRTGGLHWPEIEEERQLSQREHIGLICSALGGLIAEEVMFGETSPGATMDLANATEHASQYVGLWGMGKSLVSFGAMRPSALDGDPIRAVLSDPDRKKEIDELLEDCRRRVERILRSKRHVVEAVRDVLLEREELIADEIEELMARLGEREPLPIHVSGDGPPPGGNGQPDGGGDGHGPSGPAPGPPSPPATPA